MTFYKKHREVLGADIVHVRRPNMQVVVVLYSHSNSRYQGIDAWLHVNPMGRDKGLAMVFNPTSERKTTNITLSLYYTGLVKVAKVSQV